MTNLVDWLRERRRMRRLRWPGPAPISSDASARTKIMRGRLRAHRDPAIGVDEVVNYRFQVEGVKTVLTGTRAAIDAQLTRSIQDYEAWDQEMSAFCEREWADRMLRRQREQERRIRAEARMRRWSRAVERVGEALLLILKILGIILLLAFAFCLMWIPELGIVALGVGIGLDGAMRDIERH